MAIEHFDYDSTPLSDLELKITELVMLGRSNTGIAETLEIEVHTPRSLQGRILFQCEVNRLINEQMAAAIHQHNYVLTVSSDSNTNRGAVIALKKLEEYVPALTAPEAIMEDMYLHSLNSIELEQVELTGIPADIKQAIKKAANQENT